jgi:putative ABC transport system permease protein
MMPVYNLLRAAYRSIMKNRLRSLLTSLGIIIGVGAVIIMVAIGQGSQKSIEEEITSLGSNLIVVFPGGSRMGGVHRGRGSHQTLTLDDVEDLEKQVTMIEHLSPIVSTGGQVIGGGNNWNTGIVGVSPAYLEIRDWELTYGQMFTEADVRSRKKVAVLGRTVADELFGGRDPTGERIRIVNTPFTVIGVLEEKGQNPMGRDEDDVILAPSTTALYRLKGGGEYINMINLSAISLAVMDAAQEEVRTILRTSHRLDPLDEDDFTIRNQADITEAATSAMETMTLLLGAVAAVSLVVGGIGIMNIMMVSVTERTREIGIRLAIGARGSDVLTQFLAEAVVLSLIGGLIGILTAFGASFVLNTFTSLRAFIQPGIVLLAFFFSGTVGVLFGFFPARKAAAMNPIDALHYE